MTAADVIGAVAGYGLPGSAPLPDQPIDETTWRGVLELATGDRVTPLLATAVADGALPTTTRQHEQAVMAHEQTMRLCLLLERSLLDVTRELADAGIEHRVLKGAGVAHLDYPSPAQRAFGDVDLLVPSAEYDHALGCLIDFGAHTATPTMYGMPRADSHVRRRSISATRARIASSPTGMVPRT